jgi:hypothetical protein
LRDLKDAQRAVNAYQAAARWFRDEKAAAEEMVGYLEGLWSSAGKETERPGALDLTQKKAMRGKIYPH